MQQQLTEDIRTVVHNPFVAAFPAHAAGLVFDNGKYDWNNPKSPTILVEVEFYDAEQVGLSDTPATRDRGFVYVTVIARPQTGSNTTREILDWFRDHLKYRVISGAQLQAPEPDTSTSYKDWYCRGLKFAFHATTP